MKVMKLPNTNFLSTRINLALVLNTDLENVEKIKKFLESLPNVRLVYQRADAQKLYIVTESERGRER